MFFQFKFQSLTNDSGLAGDFPAVIDTDDMESENEDDSSNDDVDDDDYVQTDDADEFFSDEEYETDETAEERNSIKSSTPKQNTSSKTRPIASLKPSRNQVTFICLILYFVFVC